MNITPGLRLRCFLVVVTVLAIAMAGTPATAAGKTKLNYRLKWVFNASVIGDVIADTQGYFSDQNLEVRVKEGSP